MTSLAPSPIPLIDCDRHHLRLTESACQTFGHSREDCIGCAKSDHIPDVGKMVKGNSWSTKFAAFIQTRAKHKQKKVEAKVELHEVQPVALKRPPGPQPKAGICSVAECQAKARAKGLCRRHYYAMYREKQGDAYTAYSREYRAAKGVCAKYGEEVRKGTCMERQRNTWDTEQGRFCSECHGKSWREVGE